MCSAKCHVRFAPESGHCSVPAHVRYGPIADISQSAAPFIIESGTGSEVRQPLRYAIVGGLPVSQILSLYTTPVIYLTLDRLRRRAAAVMYVPSKLKSSASPPYCGNTKFVLQFRLDGFYEGRIHFLSLWKCIGPGS
jgi:AcrB/AcrD/AcrF family